MGNSRQTHSWLSHIFVGMHVVFSQSLAERVRGAVARERGVTEKRMFGGIAFLLRGNLCLAVWHDSLILRVGTEEYAAALARPFARPFDITGRPMAGWVMVEPDGLDAEHDLRDWITLGIDFVGSLPAKPAGKSPTRRKARPKPAADEARGKNTSAAKALRGRPGKRK